MKKKLMALIMAVSFIGASSGSVLAAKSCKGIVKEFDGKVMVIKIEGKCKVEPGTKVKIKPKKKAAIEGC
ncbi:hypothetical protein Thein_0300 [Thermodesulfatator indicus DSM 15286]|uniref:Uncharacterized protein n=1 Tax=Thermodesulfatator indicus (strain DSM 15286 / JCM 11887 / CIR29812) TaxID=667014 RepID=F8A9Y3_THEID|nr:hypothetical protein [Thermodesulfatator indicus]AEH44184.1 hypothetical protein Thein_0300 [Thermodesulfatator indicus DSM 15286]